MRQKVSLSSVIDFIAQLSLARPLLQTDYALEFFIISNLVALGDVLRSVWLFLSMAQPFRISPAPRPTVDQTTNTYRTWTSLSITHAQHMVGRPVRPTVTWRGKNGSGVHEFACWNDV
jgi:hypothetical protein